MKLLLTGASGFLGKAVLQRLSISLKYRITAAVRNQLPIELTHVECVRIGELSTQVRWEDSLSDAQVVIHLAGRAHVMRENTSDPLAAFRATNTAATLHLAREAARAGVRRFVFMSSVKVQGECSAQGRPFLESMAPAPGDAYALSKHEAEQELQQIAAGSGMEVVIIRPPLVYGPGVKANFAALMQAVARGLPLPLGALHNRRSLVALDNLVDLIETCITHPGAANEAFLVSDGEDLSTTDLVRRLAQAMDRPARLVPVPAWLLTVAARLAGRGAAAERLCGNLQVDISKARRLLGWSPPISVDEGLRRAVAGMSPR